MLEDLGAVLASTLSPLHIERLMVRGLRNLAHVALEPSPRFNVVAGDNGHGKTNLLEAVYVVATSRSFRARTPGELVEHGGESAHVRAVAVEGAAEKAVKRELGIGLRTGQRKVLLDGKRPRTLAEYAVVTPVVVFHPGEMALSSGPSSERRRLLDRVALYATPASLAEGEAYTRAVRERQRALEDRGSHAADLDAWEALVVRHGLALRTGRDLAARALAEESARVFEEIAAPGLSLAVSYETNFPADAAAYHQVLSASRPRDTARRSASVGPHRDELRLEVGGHVARGTASQGQHRAVTLALKAAEMCVIGRARGARPILLLDDVSSELDRDRTAALLGYLRGQRGQVFLTTTRPELIDLGVAEAPQERADFIVERGTLRRA